MPRKNKNDEEYNNSDDEIGLIDSLFSFKCNGEPSKLRGNKQAYISTIYLLSVCFHCHLLSLSFSLSLVISVPLIYSTTDGAVHPHGNSDLVCMEISRRPLKRIPHCMQQHTQRLLFMHDFRHSSGGIILGH